MYTAIAHYLYVPGSVLYALVRSDPVVVES